MCWIFCPRFTDRGKHLYRFELYLFDLIQCNLMGSYPISSTTDGPSLTDQIVFHGLIQSDMLYSVYTSFHLFNHPFLSLLMKEITSYKNFKWELGLVFTWLGWIPEILGFLNPGNETWIWKAQIIELQKSFRMISILNQFPGNQT